MKRTENLTAKSVEKKSQNNGIDFLGLATVRVLKEVGHLQSIYLPFVADGGDSAYLGQQTEGNYSLELWFEESVLAEAGLDVVVLQKTFYNNKNGQPQPSSKGDLRKTGGEFEKKDWWKETVDGKSFHVFVQRFAVAPKGKVSGRLVTVENDNNLYVVLASVAGIQTYAISAYFDQKQDNGLYLTVEPVWMGSVGKVVGKFSCHVLERKRGGSPALFQIIKEHYAPKMKDLSEIAEVVGLEKEEILNVSGLRAWGQDGNLLVSGASPMEAKEIEVFCYMVSGPRHLSFGRDRWGRQVYLNWNNVVFSPQIRRVQNGAMVRCKPNIEQHSNFNRQKVDLVRGLEIQILPEKETQSRINELAKLGGQWVEWQDWFKEEKVEDHAEVKIRAKNPSRPAERPLKKRNYWQKPLVGVSEAFSLAKK
ncbi:MAG: hypothetical protein WCV55_00795 [Candidatus Paceibacterota bacterium]